MVVSKEEKNYAWIFVIDITRIMLWFTCKFNIYRNYELEFYKDSKKDWWARNNKVEKYIFIYIYLFKMELFAFLTCYFEFD